MVLLLHQDFANMLRHGIFAKCITLANTFAIIANRLRFIFQVKAQHFLGSCRGAHLFRPDRRHSPKVVNLFGNNQGAAQLFLDIFSSSAAMFMYSAPFRTCL